MDGVLPVPAALGGDFVPLELSHGSEHSSGYLQPSTAEALSFDGAADEPPRAVTPPRLGGAGGRAARRAAAAAAAFALGGSVGQLEAAIAAPAFIESDAPCRSGPSCQICPPFTCASLDSYGRQLLPGGVRRRLIADEQGSAIRWPWDPRADVELQPTRAVNAAPGCPDPARPYFAALDPLSGSLSAHEADATVAAGLQAATSDGAGGENTTGVRAWKQFCGRNAREFIRPVAPEAPLWVKLHEEQWIMRFVAHLVDSRDIEATTARTYFGQASAWHQRKTGIGFAGGLDLKRLPEMVKGLRRLRDEPSVRVRRGVTPQKLRAGLDKLFPAGSAVNANVRGCCSTSFQGLLRGREAGSDAKKGWQPDLDLARGDIAALTSERLVFFMRPAKNMRHTKGKTVPIVIGAGGTYIDAHAEMAAMLRLDPAPSGSEAVTPMFRRADGSPFTVDYIRDVVKLIMAAVGEPPEEYGAHSLRIGGATALFAAGADPIHIRTMGRWSSDCWRLYVRACFQQTMSWTKKAGSVVVHDVAGDARRAGQELDEDLI